MMDFIDDAEDIFLDDEAEELEDAMDDLVEDDYSDIDNIADIDDDTVIEDSDEDEDDEEDGLDGTDDGYVDYEVPEGYN